MNYLEKINELWDREHGDLQVILNDLSYLIRGARKDRVQIPSHIERDIILQANYSVGFGSDLDDMRIILDLLKDLASIEINIKYYRFASLACSAIISSISFDAQNHTNNTAKVLQSYNIKLQSSISEQIDVVLKELSGKLNNNDKQTFWWFELLSFITILLSTIKQLESWNDFHTEYLNELKQLLSHNDRNEEIFDDWRSTWVEKNDYFRFNILLITDKFASDKLWIDMIQSIIDK